MAIDQKHDDISLSTEWQQVQSKTRAATSAQIAAYTGTRGELIYDTTNDRIVVMDGSTAGGIPINSAAGVAAVQADVDRLKLSTSSRNVWTWNLKNNAGTLEHSFNNPADGSVDAPLIGGINSPQGATFAPVAVGTDASTAFTGGAKVSTAATERAIFDTADISNSALLDMAVAIAFNSTGTALLPKLAVVSRDVNGTTRERLEVAFFNGTDGTAFALNTTNIASTKQISIQVFGLMPDFA